MKFDGLAAEYASLWKSMKVIRMSASIRNTAEKIVANRKRYSDIEEKTKVPWYVVGVIHAMESGCRFDCHLHNGDPLNARTKLVPAGRPRSGKGPFTWEESATDALLMKDYDDLPDWSIERICWALENYNGWGYRKHHASTLSPYLWSGSQHYARGKYVADGKWSATAVSSQSGAMPILKEICSLCPDIRIPSTFDPPSKPDTISADGEDALAPASYRKAIPDVTADTVAKDGSRSMSWLTHLKTWLAGTGLTILSFTGADTIGGFRSTLDELKAIISDQALVIVMLAVGMVLAVVLMAQHRLVQAARDGRYQPSKGQ